jgi:hypothetical protein
MDELRGRKEIINGQEIDQSGLHLKESAIEELLLKAGLGESSSSKNSEEVNSEEDLDLQGDVENVNGMLVDKNGFHLNKDSFLSTITSSIKSVSSANFAKKPQNKGKQAQNAASFDLGMFQPVWEELSKIPFSENSEEEMQPIVKAIREAGASLKVKKIIANTKLLAKNAEKFYYSDAGVRAVFSILGNKYSMGAVGEFTGKEAFYIQVNGDSLEGIVLLKDDSGDYSDITNKYKIEIKRV